LQRRRYAELIERAIRMVAENPERPGSRQRDDLATGVRSLHVELAARRRGAAAHVLYYLRGRLDDGRDGVIIIRVLHDRMEPLRHLTRGLP
jgi:toxin ParE1/3/4